MHFIIGLFVLSACTSPFENHPKFDVGDCVGSIVSDDNRSVSRVILVNDKEYHLAFNSPIDGNRVYYTFPINIYDRVSIKIDCPDGL